MGDWLGLLFFTLLIVAIFFTLRMLANPKIRTSEEFERDAAKSASMLGITMNVLHGILDSPETRAKEIRMQLKGGGYRRKKSDGKANGRDLNEETSSISSDVP